MFRTLLLAVTTAVLALNASLGLAAPMPAPACFDPGQKFDSRFVGNWEIAEWQVRYSIRAKGKQVCLYGRDVQADEWFDIPEMSWDGKTLSVSFVLPSTKWRTQNRLTVLGPDTIRDEYTTRDGKRTDTWIRRQ
jgi:hypothetical protein